MKSGAVKFAVVGCGHIGKRHVEMIMRNPDAELVAMADTRPRHILRLDAYTTIPFYGSLDELLHNCPEVEVVCIATPNGVHGEQALKCLNARKHIVVEKPLALSKAEAEEIIYRALHVNRYVFSVMQNRYSPPSVWLKEIVSSGKLGKIFMVQVNCYWNRDERYYHNDSWHGDLDMDGGTLYTQFSHFIDIMYWLFGDLQNIQSRLACHNHEHITDFEDSGFITFEFRNGGMGCFNFTTSVWNRNMESSMTIIAEHGSIKVGGQYMNEVEYCHIRDYEMPSLPATNPANDYGAYKGSASNHHYIFENVLNVLRGKEAITTNALEGLKVVEMIEQMYGENRFAFMRSMEYRPPMREKKNAAAMPAAVVHKRREILVTG